MTRFVMLAGLAAIAGCGAHPAPLPTSGRAETSKPVASRPIPSFEADVEPAIARHCLECHDESTKRGGIALDAESIPFETWGRVADALRAGTMPPGRRPRPSSDELAAINGWLDAEVFRCSATDPDPGRVTMRRLNRTEYDNTLRDLLGLELRLAEAFPADDVGYGFDNIGDTLSMPPLLMEKYLEAANRAIEAAARSPFAWSRIMNPPPDAIPIAWRKPTFPVRTEPVKRIGLPPSVSPAPPVEDPEVVALRGAREILRGFADRAFRRPATADELARMVGLVESARKDGDGMDEAIRHALKAVLISPAFLFHVEEQPEAGGGRQRRLIGEFELASRLSYFLWSSPPDDELYRLSATGELREGENLATQVRRMLRDGKARALADGFALQWLQARTLRDITPDPARFPGFDEALRLAMIEETSRFAGAILLEDGGVYDFLDADYTFVNARLARHYGIEGVVGDEFRRVSLRGTGRCGVATHASILSVTSHPTRTSPVKRGKWVLDNLLGMPPPPPPEGVEGLRADSTPGHGEPLRRRMERHRDDPSCASCHARMDPLGFALEDFDAIGGRRSSDEGVPIDHSGRLPDGESFEGASGLRDVLMARRPAFAACLAEKLLTYALGRGLGPGDRCYVAEVVRKLERGNGRSSSLILAIVESPPFQRSSGMKEAK